MNKTSLIRTVVSTWQATQHLHSSHRGPCQGAAFPKLQSHFSVSLCFSSELILTFVYSLSIRGNPVMGHHVSVDTIIPSSMFGGKIWGVWWELLLHSSSSRDQVTQEIMGCPVWAKQCRHFRKVRRMRQDHCQRQKFWTFTYNKEIVVELLTLLQPHRLQPTELLCPWDSPGKKTEVGCHFLLQGIFLTQGSNPCLLHCRRILYHWATDKGTDSAPSSLTVFPNLLVNELFQTHNSFFYGNWVLSDG